MNKAFVYVRETQPSNLKNKNKLILERLLNVIFINTIISLDLIHQFFRFFSFFLAKEKIPTSATKKVKIKLIYFIRYFENASCRFRTELAQVGIFLCAA